MRGFLYASVAVGLIPIEAFGGGGSPSPYSYQYVVPTQTQKPLAMNNGYSHQANVPPVNYSTQKVTIPVQSAPSPYLNTNPYPVTQYSVNTPKPYGYATTITPTMTPTVNPLVQNSGSLSQNISQEVSKQQALIQQAQQVKDQQARLLKEQQLQIQAQQLAQQRKLELEIQEQQTLLQQQSAQLSSLLQQNPTQNYATPLPNYTPTQSSFQPPSQPQQQYRDDSLEDMPDYPPQQITQQYSAPVPAAFYSQQPQRMPQSNYIVPQTSTPQYAATTQVNPYLQAQQVQQYAPTSVPPTMYGQPEYEDDPEYTIPVNGQQSQYAQNPQYSPQQAYAEEDPEYPYQQQTSQQYMQQPAVYPYQAQYAQPAYGAGNPYQQTTTDPIATGFNLLETIALAAGQHKAATPPPAPEQIRQVQSSPPSSNTNVFGNEAKAAPVYPNVFANQQPIQQNTQQTGQRNNYDEVVVEVYVDDDGNPLPVQNPQQNQSQIYQTRMPHQRQII